MTSGVNPRKPSQAPARALDEIKAARSALSRALTLLKGGRLTEARMRLMAAVENGRDLIADLEKRCKELAP